MKEVNSVSFLILLAILTSSLLTAMTGCGEDEEEGNLTSETLIH